MEIAVAKKKKKKKHEMCTGKYLRQSLFFKRGCNCTTTRDLGLKVLKGLFNGGFRQP